MFLVPATFNETKNTKFQQNQTPINNPTMNFNTNQPTETEPETEMMMNNVKVVEYMLSSMSNELLCKFPDNSAFDFDYTQSSIWSPLVPHPSFPLNVDGLLMKQLSYEEECGDEGIVNKFTGNVKDKVSGSCVFSCFTGECRMSTNKNKNKVVVMKRRRSGLGSGLVNLECLGVDRACNSPNKGWKKVLKAASKQFKKTMKKKDSSAHLKLSSNPYSRFLN